jgi:hypothetical protein
MVKEFTEDDRKKMDEAGSEAHKEFDDLLLEKAEEVSPLIDWFLKWYLKAGYKRLGRILVAEAKARQKKTLG